MFGSHKVLRKEEKNDKENDFFIFGFIINFFKEN